jgi:predicted dehydrogenase
VYAVISNDVYGEEVEDFAQVTMEMVDGALCIIECSYSHAVAPWTPGFEFSLHSKRHHFRSMGKEVMTWSDQLGNPNYLEGPHGNTASYPAFVADTIDAFQNGRPPIATIEDDVASLRIVDAAYRSAASGEVVRLD